MTELAPAVYRSVTDELRLPVQPYALQAQLRQPAHPGLPRLPWGRPVRRPRTGGVRPHIRALLRRVGRRRSAVRGGGGPARATGAGGSPA